MTTPQPSATPRPTVRRLTTSDREAVVELSVRAWAPVFSSIEATLGSALFDTQYPRGWEVTQRGAVQEACDADDIRVWIAEVDTEAGPGIAGFVAARLHEADHLGEIYMIATDPPYQRRGTARLLMDAATAWMAEQGMTAVMVETGGDPGHAPARRTYENAGFTAFPVSRYFRLL